MKKNIMCIVFLFVFVIFPSNIKAICYNKDKTRFISIAGNISSTYVFDDNSKTFNIIISNIYNGFIVKDVNKGIDHPYSNSELTFTGYLPGQSYRFDIFTSDVSCSDVTLKSLYITLPLYNPNYADPLCSGLENYGICQKWGKYISDHDEFEKQINQLNKEDIKQTMEETSEEYLGVFDHLARFFVKSYYVILPIIIVVCLMGIYQLNKKDRLF